MDRHDRDDTVIRPICRRRFTAPKYLGSMVGTGTNPDYPTSCSLLRSRPHWKCEG